MKKILRSSRAIAPLPSPSCSDELNKSAQDIETCTLSQCITDRKKDRLTCTECERSVHYSCSELPPYYIQLIVGNVKDIKFICVNCVTVTKKIADKYPSPSQKIKSLQRDVTNCENIIKIKAEKEKELIKKYEEDKIVADARVKELAELKKKLDNNPALHTLEYVEQKIESNMEKFKQSIQKLIKTEINVISEKSYADAAKTQEVSAKQITIREAIREAWRVEEAEENDKIKRARNVIIHGLTESNDDNSWAEDLVKDTHTRATIKRVTRLGKPSQEKKRPLLVCLSTEKEKFSLLGNLSSLRSIQKYKEISVTEDLTPEERKRVRELSIQAKERNKTVSSDTGKWRVRGDSKNGFDLIKIKSKTQTKKTDKKKVAFAENLTQTKEIEED